MKKYFILITLFVFSGYAKSQIFAGSWKSDITPQDAEFSGTCLGGYGAPFSRCNSTEVLDSISVRAVSIREDNNEILMIVIDTVGIGDQLSEDIKQTIFDWTGGYIPKNKIKTIATHTHAGPDLQGLWGGVSSEYRQRIVEQSAMTGILARLFSFKAKIYAAETTANVQNRRGWDVVDDSVNVLQFRSKRHKHTIATLVNMSAHPTIMDETNLGYSAGFINSLRDEVESETHGISVFINGVVGDAQPVVESRTYEESQAFGEIVASNVIEALDNKERIKGRLNIETATMNHPLTNPLVLYAHSLGLVDLDLNEDNTIDTKFSYFTIGDKLSGIGFPGEALSRLGLPLKANMSTKYKMFLGLYDDSYGYFIPSDEYGQIPGRTTEEGAAIDIGIGDEATTILNGLLD